MPWDGPHHYAPYSLRSRLARRAAGDRWTAAAIIAAPLLVGLLLGWLIP
jgi:hypothetical protein